MKFRINSIVLLDYFEEANDSNMESF